MDIIDKAKLVPEFNLYFSNHSAAGTTKTVFFFRLLTQIFSASKWEHVGSGKTCPKERDGDIIVFPDGKIITCEAGEVYFFEANVKKGFQMTTFDDKIQSLKEENVEVDYQPLSIQCTKKELLYSWDSAVRMATKEINGDYDKTLAFLSAFDYLKIARWFRGLYLKHHKSTVGAFCSLFSGKNSGEVLNRVEMDFMKCITMTPEDLHEYLAIKNDYAEMAEPLLRALDGKIYVYPRFTKS